MRKFLLLLGVSFYVIVIFSGCAGITTNLGGNRSPVIAQHQKDALEYEKSGDLPMAVLSWKIVSRMEPENSEAAQRVKTLEEQIASKAEKHFAAGVRYFKKNP